MLRLLGLATAAVLLWLMLEGGIAAVRTRLRGGGPPRAVPPPRPAAHLPLVRCASCGVHLPQQRALEEAGRWYCSPVCRRVAGGERP